MDKLSHTIPTNQIIYDSYNNIMFSNDKRVFNKMTMKIELYNLIKELAGDIIEVGVFKGSGMALFLKLKEMYEPNSIMKVIGFDYFNKDNCINNLSGLNKEMMKLVLDRVDSNDITLSSVMNSLSCFNINDYLLIDGDATETTKSFTIENPGMRIKLLYMDIDLGEPTYNVLITLWNRVVKNGVIIFDEYGFHKWDESEGVDKFLDRRAF